jgi:hypothetical protein
MSEPAKYMGEGIMKEGKEGIMKERTQLKMSGNDVERKDGLQRGTKLCADVENLNEISGRRDTTWEWKKAASFSPSRSEVFRSVTAFIPTHL